MVKLLPILKMTSDWKTSEVKSRERKTQQLVTQVYTVWLLASTVIQCDYGTKMYLQL